MRDNLPRAIRLSFFDDSEGLVAKTSDQPKKIFQKNLIHAISQKGNNVYQNVKGYQTKPHHLYQQTTKNTRRSTLNTIYSPGAGFEVSNEGVSRMSHKCGKGGAGAFVC